MRQHFRPEGADRQRIGQRPCYSQLNFVRDLLPENFAFCKFRDVWLERYIAFVEREIIDARYGGSIGRRYHRCALTAYAEFQASGEPFDRFRTWFAIHAAGRWLGETAGATR
jgi:hypothetical protein